jgi:hypothetical protein
MQLPPDSHPRQSVSVETAEGLDIVVKVSQNLKLIFLAKDRPAWKPVEACCINTKTCTNSASRENHPLRGMPMPLQATNNAVSDTNSEEDSRWRRSIAIANDTSGVPRPRLRRQHSNESNETMESGRASEAPVSTPRTTYRQWSGSTAQPVLIGPQQSVPG